MGSGEYKAVQEMDTIPCDPPPDSQRITLPSMTMGQLPEFDENEELPP